MAATDSFGRRLRSLLYYRDDIPLEAIDEVAVRMEQTIEQWLAGRRCGNPALDRGINMMAMSTRLYNVLRNGNVATFRDLTKLDAKDLLRFKNCGKGTVRELESLLPEFGITLGQDKRA